MVGPENSNVLLQVTEENNSVGRFSALFSTHYQESASDKHVTMIQNRFTLLMSSM